MPARASSMALGEKPDSELITIAEIRVARWVLRNGYRQAR
jgi:hypothetical protein